MTFFTTELYRNFLNRGEAELYEELRSTYEELIARKVDRIDYPEDTKISQIRRIRCNCRVCQQAILHRALYCFDGSLTALSQQNVYALVLCIRGHYEATASLGYLHKRITSYIEGNITLNDFDRDVYGQVLGSRHNSIEHAPDPKNIMTQLDYADKVVNKEILQSEKKHNLLRDSYDFLSEFAHPNFHSYAASLQIDKSNRSFVFRYGQPLRDKHFNLIGYISISNQIFIDLFDRFGSCIERIH